MQTVVDLLASGASAATVVGVVMAYGSSRATKRHKDRELRRKLDQVEQTKHIQTAIGELKASVDDRFDKNDEFTQAATRRIDRLEDEQFGPNHGGARQAINELTADVKSLSTSLAKVSERVVRCETILSAAPAPLVVKA